MSHSTSAYHEQNSTSRLLEKPRVLVVKKHHFLVRWSHWLNGPILLGLILSGISVYWASPIYQHKPDPKTGSFDVAADIGIWICSHVPGLQHYSNPPGRRPLARSARGDERNPPRLGLEHPWTPRGMERRRL